VGLAGGMKLDVGSPLEAVPWEHGVSILGDLKYPAGFGQFNYVDAHAARAGAARQAAMGNL
jgi:microcin C transport system substrate-binding protein